MFSASDGFEPGLRYLLSLIDPSGASLALERYRTASNHCLFAINGSDEEAIACIGVEVTGSGEGLIRHVAVALEHRRRGHGRALVEGAIAELDLRRLEAEAEWPVAGFFRALGFRVWSLTVVDPAEGEREGDGAEQAMPELYRCVWARS